MNRINRGKDQDASPNWCDLPQSFIASLLYFLSPRSRCAFKATCKSWSESKLLLPVPVGSPLSPCHSSPFLISTKIHVDSVMLSYKCYHPMTGECFRLKFSTRCQKAQNNLEDTVVESSNFGWLLLSGVSRAWGMPYLFFINPFTKREFHLKTAAFEAFSALCFTSPPTCPDPGQQISGMFLRPGRFRGSFDVMRGGGSRCVGLPEVLENHHLSPHNSLVFYRGLFYCLVGAGVVGVSHAVKTYDDEKKYTFHDTKLFEPGTRLRHSFLIEVDGKLLGIFDYQGIRVLWLDSERWKWNPVGDKDLRDKILYVGYKGSFVQCDETTKGVGNKIYFPTIINGGGVYYSLDTKKYHTPSGELDEIGDYGNSMAWTTPPIDDDDDDDGSCIGSHTTDTTRKTSCSDTILELLRQLKASQNN